jgi:hypothetical protein
MNQEKIFVLYSSKYGILLFNYNFQSCACWLLNIAVSNIDPHVLLEYAIINIQENQERLELNLLNQILVHINVLVFLLLAENMNTIKNNTEINLIANRDKSKYMNMSQNQNSHKVILCNEVFYNVQNCI